MNINEYKNLKVGDYFSNTKEMESVVNAVDFLRFDEGTIFQVMMIEKTVRNTYIQFSCKDTNTISKFGLNSINSKICIMRLDLNREEKLKSILS